MNFWMEKCRRALAPTLAVALSLSAFACGGDEEGEKGVTCEQLVCGHGQCVEGATEKDDATCACETGWAGEKCDACAEGLQDNDKDGVCKPTCETSELVCGQNASCNDESGEATCACDAGMQDKDADGNCSEACTEQTCGENATCSDETGTATCACNDGFVMKEGVCEEFSSNWTIMVYLDGDNDLEEYAKEDLQEMKSMSASEGINLIVLADMRKKRDTKLYQVLGGQLKELKQEDVGAFIFDNKEASMNDWQTLKRFGEWAVETYPAKSYALFLWNHGGGWKNSNAKGRCTGAPTFRDFAQDEHSTMDSTEMLQLSGGDFTKALKAMTAKAGKKIDLVGFDACLMGMYEVATACQDDADYLVASEESEPAEGWAYNKFLPTLVAKPDMTASELGKIIVDAYHTSLEYNATLSLVDLSQMGDVHAKLSDFASDLITDMSDRVRASSIKNNRNNTQSFDYPEHVDLMDFAKRIQSDQAMPQETKASATQLISVLESAIIYNKTNSFALVDDEWFSMTYEEYHYENANGMAIFFPLSIGGYDDQYSRTDWLLYKNASWAPLSTWDEFIGKVISDSSRM